MISTDEEIIEKEQTKNALQTALQRIEALEEAQKEQDKIVNELTTLRARGIGAMWTLSIICGFLVTISSDRCREMLGHFFTSPKP